MDEKAGEYVKFIQIISIIVLSSAGPILYIIVECFYWHRILIYSASSSGLGYKRVVKLDHHSQFANKYGMKYFFMSARTGDNVNAAMLKIASDLAGVKQTIIELETSTSQATATIQRFGEAASNEQEESDKDKQKKKKKKSEDCMIL
ncbi:MAG: hypothetical protein EZS28_001512 [Streblomastix strix]|uniref:Uncharacterized protein n=1 Tax=Streblomastix strix TaxID=222440 RepID=A0A5J4X6Z1_9EUKA|nr:MAG: hypothetical protein EZS28_001512 [Streblomastix strix]